MAYWKDLEKFTYKWIHIFDIHNKDTNGILDSFDKGYVYVWDLEDEALIRIGKDFVRDYREYTPKISDYRKMIRIIFL
jgi:hypothetical protein